MPVHIGCSGWSYSDYADKGGWVKIFYPDTQTKKLQYYSQFFNRAEIDATFYEKFYKYMTKETFVNMTKATLDNFQFSVKVPETVTHDKRLDVNKVTNEEFKKLLEEFDKSLGSYKEIFFYCNPGRFHKLYKRLISKSKLKNSIKLFTHISEINYGRE